MATATFADIPIGACTLTWGGVSLGLTSGGVKLNVAFELKRLNDDQFGNVLSDDMIVKTSASVVCTIAQAKIDGLIEMLPGMISTVDGTKRKLEIRNVTSTMRTYAKELIITPIWAQSANDIVSIPLAVPMVKFEFDYSHNKEGAIEVTFVAKEDANKTLIVFGDETAI
jgi:hypothetical protein